LRPIRSPAEWLIFALLSAIAQIMFFAGISMVAPAGSLFFFSPHDARAVTAAGAALCFGAIFAAAGFVSRRLIRSRRPFFPNEREARAAARPVDGWLLLMAFTLAVLPLTTFHELAPLRALWSDAIRLLRENHILDGAMRGGQLSGLVLMPVAMALFTPVLQFAAAGMFAAGSVASLLLLWLRSVRFPRGYVVCLSLQAALVLTSAYSTVLARHMANWVSEQAGATAGQMRDLEHVRVLQAVERYDDVLQGASRSLALAAAAYALWLPALMMSARVRETFAPLADDAAPEGHDISAAASANGGRAGAMGADPRALDPAARKKFYEAAARALQERID
jgi:hypothetical protein